MSTFPGAKGAERTTQDLAERQTAMWEGGPAKPWWEDRIIIPKNAFAGPSVSCQTHCQIEDSSGLRSGRVAVWPTKVTPLM